MITGDDWFTKTMLSTSIARNENLQNKLVNGSTVDENLFSNILSQILIQKEMESSALNREITNYVPEGMLDVTQFIAAQTFNQRTLDSLNFHGISEEKLNQNLKGKLSGMGYAFIRAGEHYNIDPALLAAIAQHETGNGKSRAAIEKNNIAGMMGKSGLKSYPSVESSIIDMARNLSQNYLNRGLTTIPEIGAKYAPIGAGNDPNGLNNHWVTGVTKQYHSLRS